MKQKLHRAWRQATADKKKFGMLLTTVMVGLLLWGRLIFVEKVPRHATADPALSGQAAGQLAGVSQGPLAQLAPLPEVRVELGDRLRQDLFAFRYDRYKPLPEDDIDPRGAQAGHPLVDKEVRRRELEEMAKDLRLQSVIQGAVPIGVINGRVVRVGGSIEGFELTGLGTRSARVTRDGQTFILTIVDE